MDRRKYIGIIAASALAGCSQTSNSDSPDGTESTEVTGTETTEEGSTDNIDIPSDPKDAGREYLERLYQYEDHEWVNEFRADDGNIGKTNESQIKESNPDVTIKSIELIEESEGRAVVKASLEIEAEGQSTSTVYEMELRVINNEWKLWDGSDSDTTVSITNVGFRYSDIEDIEAVARVENDTQERVQIEVLVEIYEGDLMIDSGSKLTEIPAGKIVERGELYLEVDDVDRITSYVVRGRFAGSREFVKISEFSGDVLREKLTE